jgi:hypothetical protein
VRRCLGAKFTEEEAMSTLQRGIIIAAESHADAKDKAGVRKLNGWQRIGIVVSIIWFIGFGAFIWTDTLRQYRDFHANSAEMCRLILNANNESLPYIENQGERNKKESANWAEYEMCEKGARAFLAREYEEATSGIPLLLVIDLGTVLFGWLVVWMFVGITRWVTRGFA